MKKINNAQKIADAAKEALKKNPCVNLRYLRELHQEEKKHNYMFYIYYFYHLKVTINSLIYYFEFFSNFFFLPFMLPIQKNYFFFQAKKNQPT